jgi:hypothetical protein
VRPARPDSLQVSCNPTPTLQQIVVGMKPEPEAIGETKVAREPQIGVGGERALARTISLMRRGGTPIARASADCERPLNQTS